MLLFWNILFSFLQEKVPVSWDAIWPVRAKHPPVWAAYNC